MPASLSAATASPALASCSGTVSVEPTTKASRRRAAAPSARERGGHVAFDAELEQLATQAGEQRRGRVERDDRAVVDDRDAVAEPLGLLEVVRRQHDRHLVALAQTGDDVEELEADPRVQADGRLVEEEDARPGHQRPRDLEPPPLAAAVAADRAVEDVREPERVGELVDARGARAVGRRPRAARAARGSRGR